MGADRAKGDAVRTFVRRALAIVGCVAAACAATPEPRYYALDATSAVLPTALAIPLIDARVQVPEEVDRPQMVLSRGHAEIVIDDGHRWAAPLEDEIAQALARDLAGSLATPDRVDLRIVTFESRLGEGVTVEATWRVSREGEVRAGSSLVEEPAHGGYDALVQAHRHAITRIASDIGGAVSSSRSVTSTHPARPSKGNAS